jgi:hypothetical protein
VSADPYDDVKDELKGSNKILILDETLTQVSLSVMAPNIPIFNIQISIWIVDVAQFCACRQCVYHIASSAL